MTQKTVSVGDAVRYYDEYGNARMALVTAVWGDVHYSGNGEMLDAPSINLVFVSPDESMTDSWGRQIGRESSLVHKSSQPAHGQYWDWR